MVAVVVVVVLVLVTVEVELVAVVIFEATNVINNGRMSSVDHI